MKNERQDKAMFVSFCIEQYAKAKNMATEDVVDLFEQYLGNIKEIKNSEITQENLYLLLPSWLSEDKGISIADAVKRIYHSQLYKKLSTASTKYWYLGPVDLYNELKAEL